MAESRDDRYLIKPQIFRYKNGSDVQVEFFIVDKEKQEFICDDIFGLVELKFASGSSAFEIDFDDFFSTEAGSFVISFFNLPNYPLKDVHITVTVGADTFTAIASLDGSDNIEEDALSFNQASDS
ncbi:hypothetical protein [Ewingella americana]|uniref:Uncharacterized protein n=1 Tax=Ewingella americana TaxID=41202 RepID=A0A502GE57_9GAMM|nr:hypothetical protein [Ewingella americana]TPG60154.1 hypothetical protein EAH77_16425 [Ewingella americana]